MIDAETGLVVVEDSLLGVEEALRTALSLVFGAVSVSDSAE
jgi:hypothetical protein